MVTISDAAVLPLDSTLENIMSDKKKTSGAFALAQRLGRSLMLPIATLPAAGLLVRLGQADMLGADGLARNLSWLQPVADIFAAAGGAVFDNLPLIFAVGVAVGFAKKADGSTGVAGLFGYLIYRAVTWIMSPIVMGKPEPLSQEALDCLHSFDPAKGEIVQVGPWNQGIKLCDIPTQTPINYGVLGGIIIGVVAALPRLQLAHQRPARRLAYQRRKLQGRRRRPGGLRLRHRQPPTHPLRPAPPAQLGALVPTRFLPNGLRRYRPR